MPGLIAHEWAERTGGAERVLDQLILAYPDAPLITLWNDAPERYPQATETWLAKTPLRRHKALALPFMLPTWRHLPVDSAPQWILVSSHLFAHHAAVDNHRDVPKYVYAHTPARYIWSPEYDARGNSGLARLASPSLRRIDKRRAAEARQIAANSEFVRRRIEATWERDARVIYPPVDVGRIGSQTRWRDVLSAADEEVLRNLPRPFILGASRLIPYKRIDLVISAGAALNMPVVVIGRGPDEEALRAYADEIGCHARFLGSPSDSLMYAVMQEAEVFVFPAIEDFGIVPVEAQALGTPTVVGPLGGQVESIEVGVSGVIADSFSVDDIAAAIDEASRLSSFSGLQVADRFGASRFRREIRELVSE